MQYWGRCLSSPMRTRPRRAGVGLAGRYVTPPHLETVLKNVPLREICGGTPRQIILVRTAPVRSACGAGSWSDGIARYLFLHGYEFIDAASQPPWRRSRATVRSVEGRIGLIEDSASVVPRPGWLGFRRPPLQNFPVFDSRLCSCRLLLGPGKLRDFAWWMRTARPSRLCLMSKALLGGEKGGREQSGSAHNKLLDICNCKHAAR